MASTPKMEYQVFLCIFQKNSAMATLGLKEMGKFLWEGREKGLSCWLSKFGKTKLRQPTVWYYERLDTMPLFLLDDLLSYSATPSLNKFSHDHIGKDMYLITCTNIT